MKSLEETGSFARELEKRHADKGKSMATPTAETGADAELLLRRKHT